MSDSIDHALDWAGQDGLFAYPTETVWGLGAAARSDRALERLRAWKGRGPGESVSILVPNPAALEELGFTWTEAARRLADAFWPGPLTLVLACAGRFARGVARSDGAVGVRCSPHPVCAELAQRARASGLGPLTATSLNRSGEPSVRTRDQARSVCSGADAPHLVDVDGCDAGGGRESTVVDVTHTQPRVLRWGALEPCDLDPLLEEATPS
jgi:L-threonylcarbamoyladenylate synthase